MGTTSANEAKLLSFDEARAVVEKYASALAATGCETLSLLDSVGLVLAEDLHADRDFPPFPRSTRDGYAVRSGDLNKVPAQLHCLGEIRAGGAPQDNEIAVAEGEAVGIMTGAPVPAWADAVVMVEYTKLSGFALTVSRSVRVGENIVPTGSEARAGDILVSRGSRVNHATVAIAAAIGRPELACHQRPRVAILATGDEVVDINLPPATNQIRNSNSYSLAAQVYAAGGEPWILPVAADQIDELTLLLRKGLEADLLLISGGVSMGRYDLVEPALAALNACFFFTGAAIQPGKPVVFGEVPIPESTKPFFGLPGNPVSTMVTFQLFVRAVLDALCGCAPQPLPFVQARLKSELTTRTGLTRFLPARLSGAVNHSEADLVRWQGSGDLAAVSRSNCYIVVPPDRQHFDAGELVTILLF